MTNSYVKPIRTEGIYKSMELYTKNQLKKKGMVPKVNAKMYELWTNSNKERKAEYYELSQCRSMTASEKLEYKDNQVNYWKKHYLELAEIVLSGNKTKLTEWKVNNEHFFPEKNKEYEK